MSVRRPVRRRSAGLLLGLALVLAGPAAAQAPGFPVYGGGFAPMLDLEGIIGIPGSTSPTGGGVALGARGTVAVGRVGVSAMVGRLFASGNTPDATVYGAMAGAKLVGDALSPFSLYLQGGVGTRTFDVPDRERLEFPVGVAASLVIPTPIVSVKPWVAPRAHVIRTTADGDTTSATEFAVGAGIDLTLIGGMALRAAYDRIADLDGTLGFSFALHF